MPICTKCKVEKKPEDFYYNGETGKQRACKECVRKYSSERHKKTYIKKPIRGKWNFSARMCYHRRCKCDGCDFENFFSGDKQKCQMKKAVAKIKRKYGEPPAEVEDPMFE